MEEYIEQSLQALYRYRKNIGWINSITFEGRNTTVCIDEFSNVDINLNFCKEYILSLEDWAFILGHEASHKTVSTILCSNFELNWRYSLLSERFSTNYMQDLFINQMLFHAIPTTLPERYYGNQKEWDLYFLQRSPKILKKCPTNTPELLNKLKLVLLACNAWYKTADYLDLYKVYEGTCDYLLLILKSNIQPESLPEQMMVSHQKEDTTPDKKLYLSEDREDNKGKIKFKLNIPLVEDFIDIQNHDCNIYQKIKSLNDLIEDQVAKIPDYFGNKSYIGYADPQPDELVSWQLEQYIPWTERFQTKPALKIKVIFDVSGSMFPYLTLLSKVKHLLQLYEAEFYSFSTLLDKIEFYQDHAETHTGAGTNLDPILNFLEGLEPCLIFIITDGAWSLRKNRLPDTIVEIFEKHKVVIFQQGISKIPYLPSSVNVISIGH
jgi:hypothetical protein